MEPILAGSAARQQHWRDAFQERVAIPCRLGGAPRPGSAARTGGPPPAGLSKSHQGVGRRRENVAMGRSQTALADDDAGHEERLRRGQKRTEQVFEAPLALNPGVTTMGTSVQLRLAAADGQVASLEMPAPDRAELGYLAMMARPFTLEREQIHFRRLVTSLMRFAASDFQRTMSDQVLRLWDTVPAARLYMHAATAGEELIQGGTTDRQVADRVLYSQLVHADDAESLLGHIDSQTQLWSLAGMVGDWVAIIAHQQLVLFTIRPDLCPVLVEWPGTPRTVFERFGAPVKEILIDEP